MKKKYIIIGIIVVLAVVLCIWLLIRPKPLGNMNFTFSKPETSISTFTFKGEANGKIRVLFESNIISGDLDIILYDSKGNIVNELARAKKMKTFLTLDNSDTYTLSAEYKDFIGDFKIALYDWK